MKGRKGSVDEGGVRVPFLISCPRGITAGMRIRQIAAHIDLLPTLADLCNLVIDQTLRLNGISLKALLDGNSTAGAGSDRMLFSHWRGKTSVRAQTFRADNTSLYDMASDPGQRQNLAEQLPTDHQRIVSAIEGDVLRAQREMQLDPEAMDPRPFPAGNQEMPLTVLPAQDCQLVGTGLAFSSRHPNASWLVGWEDTESYPSWNVEVVTDGTCEIAVSYTGSVADVGATLEVNFQGHRASGRVLEEFDPPLYEARDRVPRAESYDKPFRLLSLGKLELPAVRGQLTLRATEIPGQEAL